MEKRSRDELLAAFARDASGAWTCVRSIELQGPNGRIQVTPGSRFAPGTVFMGVDLASWLDQKTASMT